MEYVFIIEFFYFKVKYRRKLFFASIIRGENNIFLYFFLSIEALYYIGEFSSL